MEWEEKKTKKEKKNKKAPSEEKRFWSWMVNSIDIEKLCEMIYTLYTTQRTFINGIKIVRILNSADSMVLILVMHIICDKLCLHCFCMHSKQFSKYKQKAIQNVQS